MKSIYAKYNVLSLAVFHLFIIPIHPSKTKSQRFGCDAAPHGSVVGLYETRLDMRESASPPTTSSLSLSLDERTGDNRLFETEHPLRFASSFQASESLDQSLLAHSSPAPSLLSSTETNRWNHSRRSTPVVADRFREIDSCNRTMGKQKGSSKINKTTRKGGSSSLTKPTAVKAKRKNNKPQNHGKNNNNNNNKRTSLGGVVVVKGGSARSGGENLLPASVNGHKNHPSNPKQQDAAKSKNHQQENQRNSVSIPSGSSSFAPPTMAAVSPSDSGSLSGAQRNRQEQFEFERQMQSLQERELASHRQTTSRRKRKQEKEKHQKENPNSSFVGTFAFQPASFSLDKSAQQILQETVDQFGSMRGVGKEVQNSTPIIANSRKYVATPEPDSPRIMSSSLSSLQQAQQQHQQLGQGHHDDSTMMFSSSTTGDARKVPSSHTVNAFAALQDDDSDDDDVLDHGFRTRHPNDGPQKKKQAKNSQKVAVPFSLAPPSFSFVSAFDATTTQPTLHRPPLQIPTATTTSDYTPPPPFASMMGFATRPTSSGHAEEEEIDPDL
jgi:hypothetical protein